MDIDVCDGVCLTEKLCLTSLYPHREGVLLLSAIKVIVVNWSNPLMFQGRKESPKLFGLEVLTYLDAVSKGKLADVSTLDDNQYIYVENDLDTTTSPYSMLLKSARFGHKGILPYQRDTLSSQHRIYTVCCP